MRKRSFSKAAQTIEVSIIKRMNLLAKKEKGAITLAQGTPSFHTPSHIIKAAKDAMDKGLADKYTDGFGIAPLRKGFAEKVQRENHIGVSEDEIIVTHGGIQALMAIFIAILNQNDEVIVLTPDYASHMTQIAIATGGKTPVCVPLIEKENEWVLDAALLEKAITSKTKAILFTNPSNPIGKVFTKEELKEIARIALKYNLYVITDEMYEHILYDGKKHISIGSFKELEDLTISVFGVSKSYSMTGWRIGYIAAKKPLIDEIFKISDSMITCPTAVSQYAALAAVNGPQQVIEEFRKEYQARRDIVTRWLAKTDRLSNIVPQGSYFAFPKFAEMWEEEDIAMQLLHEAKVAVVPGEPFGKGGEQHIRISFGVERDELEEGMKRIVNFFNQKL